MVERQPSKLDVAGSNPVSRSNPLLVGRGPAMHIAPLNIARLRADRDDPIVADFFAAIDPINAVADVSPGFVWRLQEEGGNATAIRPWDDDRRP